MGPDQGHLQRLARRRDGRAHRRMQGLDRGEWPLRRDALGDPGRVFEHAAEGGDERRWRRLVQGIERHAATIARGGREVEPRPYSNESLNSSGANS